MYVCPDNYVSNLLEQENLEVLNHLILDGYDKLDAVLAQVSTEGLPEKVTDFVLAIPQLQVTELPTRGLHFVYVSLGLE